jgi:phosphohistidine swiveling domain-containing protein
LAAITSSGGYFSHIAVLSRKYNKPCVGGIWGCERIFQNGEKIKIKNEIIDKS